jgi:pilus assembly protein Flp/PilA
MKTLLVRLWKDEQGQDLTEYALLLVLLTLAAVGALGTLASAINGTFANRNLSSKNYRSIRCIDFGASRG